MNAAASNLAISLVVMQSEKNVISLITLVFDVLFLQVARKIPFDDPEVLLYARIGYVSAQLIVLTAYFVCSSKVSTRPFQHAEYRPLHDTRLSRRTT